jgi:16S rRNA (cytosine967-C5)-methyltransferase
MLMKMNKYDAENLKSNVCYICATDVPEKFTMRAFYREAALFLAILGQSYGFLGSKYVVSCKEKAVTGPNQIIERTFVSLSASANNDDKTSSVATKTKGVSKDPNSSVRYLAAKALLPGSPGYLVDKLEGLTGYKQLPTRDRSFGRLMVTTTERRLGQIDKVLELCQNDGVNSKRKLGRIDLYVQAVLRVGAVQLLFLGVPPHAAVKETVDVLRLDRSIKVPESRIKFVNAVLRRLSREGQDLLAKTSLSDNVAEWLHNEWKEAWGEGATSRIIESAMEETPRCLSIKLDPQDSSEERMERKKEIAGWFPESEILPHGSVVIPKPPPGAISVWPLYQEGAWWLQDVSATLPAIALYNGLSQRGEKQVDDMHVVDMCAAPGGKTAQLCTYGFASVTAVEKSVKRSRRLEQNKERLKMDWEIIVADGSEWIPSDKTVAGILVDAPCTATGTGSKRPDVLRKDPQYKELLKDQYALACHAADNILQPDGILVYATCSLLKQESEHQVAKLLEREDGAKLETVPFQPGEIPGFDESIDENGWMRVLPGSLTGSLNRCDGFFVARLRVVQR